jgi:ketosteroid isomerase-like protein
VAFKLSDGTFKCEPEAFFADDDRVVVLDHVTGTRNGKTLNTYVIQVFRVGGGKVIETTTFVAEPKRHEQFWA